MTRPVTSKQRVSQRRPRSLGIGTIVTVLGLLAVITVAQWHQVRPSDPQMGRIVYQADATGKLRRVNSASQRIMPPSPLWKPEVGFILTRARQLRLDAAHEQFIARQNSLWIAEKEAMELAMQRSTANLASASEGPSHPAVGVGQLNTSLQDYSTISARYNRRREYYWLRAVSALTPTQHTMLENFRRDAK